LLDAAGKGVLAVRAGGSLDEGTFLGSIGGLAPGVYRVQVTMTYADLYTGAEYEQKTAWKIVVVPLRRP
jgi:hypothetical protein